MKNYLHFPAKLQNKDNVRSIFDEFSFKHIPRDYLKIFEESSHKLKEESEKLKHDMIESPITNVSDINNLTKYKSEMLVQEHNSDMALRRHSSATGISEHESGGTEGTKKDIEIGKIESNKSEPEQTQLMQFLNHYKHILKSDSIQRLTGKNQDDTKDTINTFNNILNSSTSEQTIGPAPLYLFMEDGTIISLLDSANKDDKTITTKLIMRNLTGKYAWSFEHLKAINDSNLSKKNLTLSDIVADKFYTNFSMRTGESDVDEKGKAGSNPSLEEEEKSLSPTENPGANRGSHDELIITEPVLQVGGYEDKKKFERTTSFRDNWREPSDTLDKFEEILNKVKEEIENFSQVILIRSTWFADISNK